MNELIELLTKNNLTITTAESCTGGMIAMTITDNPGSSQYFKEGIVTYSNEAKSRHLNVPDEILDKYGAVSEQTAHYMVKGALKFAQSDVAIAVTGIAGPTGGSEKKPVGLVYIGTGFNDVVNVNQYIFSGDRGEIRQKTTNQALKLAAQLIDDKIG